MTDYTNRGDTSCWADMLTVTLRSYPALAQSAACCTAGLSAALRVTQLVTRPVYALHAAADRIVAGRPGRVTPSGPAELAELMANFNRMAQTLEERWLDHGAAGIATVGEQCIEGRRGRRVDTTVERVGALDRLELHKQRSAAARCPRHRHHFTDRRGYGAGVSELSDWSFQSTIEPSEYVCRTSK